MPVKAEQHRRPVAVARPASSLAVPSAAGGTAAAAGGAPAASGGGNGGGRGGNGADGGSESIQRSAEDCLELLCPKCSLAFDSKRALFIHTEKFCGRIKEVAAEEAVEAPISYMTFEEVKRYLESHGADDPDTGKLSLEDIKMNVQHNDVEMRNLRAQLQKKKAEQKVEELRKLKVRQQQARANKLRDHADMEDLIQMELQQKEKELQAGIEREKIGRELKKIKEGRLGQLQDEKSRSLALLEKEKESLKRREHEVLEQIKQLENRIIKRDAELEEEAAQLAAAPGKEFVKRNDEVKKTYEAMAREHGARLARMEQEKRELAEEQKRHAQELRDVQAREAAENVQVSSDKLQAALDKLTSEKGIRDQEARVAALKQEAAANELDPVETITGPPDSSAARDQELNALYSERPMRLPLAKDAEKFLDSWLVSDAPGAGRKTFNGFSESLRDTVGGGGSGERDSDPPSAREAGGGRTDRRGGNGRSDRRGRDGEDTYISPQTSDFDASFRGKKAGFRREPTVDTMDVDDNPRTRRVGGATPKRVNMNTTNSDVPGGCDAERDQLVKDLERLKKRYREQGGKSSAVLERIEQLEAELDGMGGDYYGGATTMAGGGGPMRSGMTTMMGGTPGYPYGAATTMGGYYPPQDMMQSMYGGGMTDMYGGGQWQSAASTMFPGATPSQQSMWQAYSQLAALEAENSRLQDDLDMTEPRLHPHVRQQRDDNIPGESPRHDMEAMQLFKKQAATEALMRTLSTLPPNHKLHKMFESHVEEVTTMQLEVDKLQRMTEFELAKERIRREKEKAKKKQEEEDMIDEQKRQVKLQKLSRGLDKGGNLTVHAQSTYDPASGFIVSLDYALGLPDRLQSGAETKKARLVYGLYESMKAFGSPASSEWLPCKALHRSLLPNPPGNTAAILDMELPFSPVPLILGLCLIVEIHAADAAATGNSNKVKFQPAGWGYMHVFEARGLCQGYHKLTLLAGSFSPAALDSALKSAAGMPVPPGKRPVPNGAALCLRLSNANEWMPELDFEEPAETFDMYLTPISTPVSTPLQPSSIFSSGLGGMAMGGDPDVNNRQTGGPAKKPYWPSVPPPLLNKQPARPSSNANNNPPAPIQSPMQVTPPQQPLGQPQHVQLAPMQFNKIEPSPSQPSSAPQAPANNEYAGQRRPSLGRRNSFGRRNSLERRGSFGANGGRNSAAGLRPLMEGQDENMRDSPGSALASQQPKTMAPDLHHLASELQHIRNMLPERDDLFLENRLAGGGDQSKGPVKPRRRFEAGDGFNIYVDGARCLPDNVTICKVTLRVLTSKNVLVGNEIITYSTPDCKRASPVFASFTEYRADTFDPTATLFIRIDTIDGQSKKLVGVGYAVLNVFNEISPSDVQAPWPSSPSTQDYQLNSGAFQIPLHQGPPNLKVDFHAGSLSAVKRVPCATMLVRILPAAPTDDGLSTLDRDNVPEDEWEARGVYLPAPSYGLVRYDTTRCMPTDIERLIYQRRERKESSTQTQTLQACIIETFAADGPTSMSADKVQEWMVNKLAPKPTEMLDYTFLLRYQPDLGFKVAVDGLCNLPAPGMLTPPKLYKVVFLLSPPALYFNDPPLTEEAHFTKTYNMESPLTAPIFTDGYEIFRDAPNDPATVVLFEVRSIKQDKTQQSMVESASDGYWSALPVFRANYINTGSFQIPLFKGSVPSAILNVTDVQEKIKELLKANANLPRNAAKPVELTEGMSLSVRLMDTLVDEYPDPIPFTGVDTTAGPSVGKVKKHTSYIKTVCEAATANAYVFDPRPIAADKTVRKALPKKVDENAFLKDANIKFAAATKISHYSFT